MTATTTDHEVVCIVHDLRFETPLVPERFPTQNEPSHVEVRQQWRDRSTNNVAKNWLTFDIVIPRSRLKAIRGQGPDFDLVQVDKEVTSTQNVGGVVHGRNKPDKEQGKKEEGSRPS